MRRLDTPTRTLPGRVRTFPGGLPVGGAAVIAWLGFLVHNVADLPDQTLLSPETSLAEPGHRNTGRPRMRPGRYVAGTGLLTWAVLNIAGGALSVLPLPVLPFTPEQSLRHYSFHVLYAATQVPLLVIAYRLTTHPTPDH